MISANQTPETVNEAPQQVLLPPTELKPYEILTDEQKVQVEFLRKNKGKKE